MEVKPFRGYRYNVQKIKDFSKVIAPPYDVIFPDVREKLLAKSDRNIAAVTKAIPETEGVIYRGAAKLWRSWLADKTIVQDAKEGFYLYKQVFTMLGKKSERYGFVVMLKLAEYGKDIKAHEKTLEGPKADRLHMLRATKTNFGQIFLLYSDIEKTTQRIIKKVIQSEPLLTAKDDDNVEHILYGIYDKETQKFLQDFFADKPLFIADGHHRYETALNYMRENPDNPEAKYRMVTLVSMHQDGLVVLPTHRLLSNYLEFDINVLIQKLEADFFIAQETSYVAIKRTMAASFKANKHSFGIVTKDMYFSLELKSFDKFKKEMTELDEVEAKLDVEILHKGIFEKFLHITDADIAAGKYISFIKGYEEQERTGLSNLRTGEAQAMFMLNQTRVEQVAEIADKGKRMPQKSTYFFPKLFTGLVMYVLNS